jgi:hypothetical protein
MGCEEGPLRRDKMAGQALGNVPRCGVDLVLACVRAGLPLMELPGTELEDDEGSIGRRAVFARAKP